MTNGTRFREPRAMIFFVLVAAAVVTLAPLTPARSVDLAQCGASASDVAWASDSELLVALVKGGVVNVSLATGRVKQWLPQAAPPDGVPFAQLVATDGRSVTVVGGGKNFAFRKSDGTPLGGYEGGMLNPRGLAVTGSSTFYLGWVSRVGTDADQQRGVLWKLELSQAVLRGRNCVCGQ